MEKSKKSSQKMNGLTLIEILIVLAIIGILVVLLAPSALTAIHKAKQKGAMKEIMTIATATADYITDQGLTPQPSPGGDITQAWVALLVPFYVKAMSSNDQWNTPYQVYTGTDVQNAGQWVGGVDPVDIGVDDFVIGSYGRDKQPSFTYSTLNPGAGLFTVDGMEDFASDLVTWNAKWISAPRHRAGN